MAKKIYKEDEYPSFEFIIDEDNILSLSRVSLVANPAIEVMGMCFSKEKDSANVSYQLFADSEKRIVAGPALIPNKKILRKDENGNPYMGYFTVDTIEKMVEVFNKNINRKPTGVINDEHTDKMVNAYVMSSWIIGDNYYDKSRMYGYDLPVGTWFIEVKVEDEEYWNDQVKGEGKYGFSIEGMMGIKPSQFNKVEEDNDEWIEILNELGWLDIDKDFQTFLKNISK